jgi:hypothetical protein
MGDGVVDGEGLVASAEEEVAVAAVPEAPRGAVLEAREQEVAPTRGGGEVRVGADGGRRVEDGELAEIRLRDEEAEDGRRGVALTEAAEEVGGRGDAAPAAGGERGAREGRRRREAEQDVLDVVVLEGVDGGCDGGCDVGLLLYLL